MTNSHSLPLKYAFKEWAVICEALAQGRQSIILRKGGIEETTGDFVVEHTRFWLFPTYVHQQEAGIKPEALSLLEKTRQEQPPANVVRLSHFAEVTGVYQLHDLPSALILQPYHVWSADTIEKRFAYKRPGLIAILTRVYRATDTFELPVTESYAGCRSWVELDYGLSSEDATPVLDAARYQEFEREIERLLTPTALA